MEISDQARDHLIPMLKEQNAAGIRLYFGGYGWGGPQIGVSLDEPQPQDSVRTINQIRVAFAGNIEGYTDDLVLEFIKESNGFALLGSNSC